MTKFHSDLNKNDRNSIVRWFDMTYFEEKLHGICKQSQNRLDCQKIKKSQKLDWSQMNAVNDLVSSVKKIFLKVSALNAYLTFVQIFKYIFGNPNTQTPRRKQQFKNMFADTPILFTAAYSYSMGHLNRCVNLLCNVFR